MMGWCDKHLGVLANRAVHGSVMYTPTLSRKHAESKTAKTKCPTDCLQDTQHYYYSFLGLGVSEKC